MLFIFAVVINHDWLAEKRIVPFTQDFSVELNLFQLLESNLKTALWRKQQVTLTLFVNQTEWVTQTNRKTGNRKGIWATTEVPEGLVRWHWSRRPYNWLGMMESRDPASLLMMRSWDWGASGQPVSHDFGSSIKVVRRINLNWQPS